LVWAVTGNAVRRNMLADPDKGFRKHLRFDHLVREHGCRMLPGSVPTLLDVNGTVFQRDCFNLPELGASYIVELLEAGKG
jgi:hypothetical protein